MKVFSVVKKIYLVVAIAFIPCLMTIFFHLYESGDWWELGMLLMPFLLLLYVIPFYLAYLEIGAAVGRAADRGLRPDGKLRPVGERRLGYASAMVAALLAGLTVGMIVFSDSAVPALLTIAYLLAYIALPVLWIIGAVVYKKRLPIKDWLRDKGILIPVLVLFLLALGLGICVLCLNLSGGFHPGGKPDPMG